MKQPKKLTPQKKDERNELYFEIQQSCLRDYHNGETYGEWEKIYNCRLTKVSRNRDLLNKWDFSSYNVPNEVYNASNVYVVIVTYSSGDSFGRSEGNLEIAFVTENAEEAIECRNALLEQDEYDRERRWSSYDKKRKSDKQPSWDDKFREHPKSVHGGYAPWNGYFESITSVDIESISVMG